MNSLSAHFLVVRLGALGDVVNTLPAVAALRRAAPGCRITWIVEEAAHSLLRCVPDVDEAVLLPRRRWEEHLLRPWRWPRLIMEMADFFRGMRQRRADISLDFHGNLKSGTVAWLCGARRRIGFERGHSREGNHLLASERVPLPPWPIHRVEKHFALVQYLFPEAQPEEPRFEIPAEDRQPIESFLSARVSRRPLVVMHPGVSAFGAFKRWPTDRFGQVARMLVEQEGAGVVVAWGPKEEQLAREVCAVSGELAVMSPRTTTLGQLAALLQAAELFIGVDSGPLHLAAALGTPVVALFGPKDPRIYRPYGKGHVVVRRNLPCSPCSRRRCTHASCMMQIQPDEVFHAAQTLLRQRKGRREPAH